MAEEILVVARIGRGDGVVAGDQGAELMCRGGWAGALRCSAMEVRAEAGPNGGGAVGAEREDGEGVEPCRTVCGGADGRR